MGYLKFAPKKQAAAIRKEMISTLRRGYLVQIGTFVSASASAGVYDPATGIWSAGYLSGSVDNELGAPSSATLIITATVDSGTGGQSITNVTRVMGNVLFTDLDESNNFSEATVVVVEPPPPDSSTPSLDLAPSLDLEQPASANEASENGGVLVSESPSSATADLLIPMGAFSGLVKRAPDPGGSSSESASADLPAPPEVMPPPVEVAPPPMEQSEPDEISLALAYTGAVEQIESAPAPFIDASVAHNPCPQCNNPEQVLRDAYFSSAFWKPDRSSIGDVRIGLYPALNHMASALAVCYGVLWLGATPNSGKRRYLLSVKPLGTSRGT